MIQVLLSLLILLPSSLAFSKLPEQALALLDKLPEKKISLDVVVALSLKNSDTFKQVASGAVSTESARLLADSIFNPKLTANLSYIDDKNEQTNAFSPQRTGTNFSLGVSKLFSTGTGVQLTLDQGSNALIFQTAGRQAFVNNQLSLEVSQNLLKNFLGQGIRASSEAGELASKAAKQELAASTEAWAYELTQTFYSAWLAQSQARSQLANLNRRRRLMKVTEAKLRRGTSEKPDYLQVQASLKSAEVQYEQAIEELTYLWRALVLALKLPESFLNLDPLEVPLLLDNPTPMATEFCQKHPGQSPQQSAKLQAATLNYNSAQALLEAQKSDALPSLNLVLGLASNGIDPSERKNTINEALELAHPQWRIGAEFVYEFGNEKAESALRERLKTKMVAEASLGLAQSEEKLNWLTACRELIRHEKAYSLIESAYEAQKERAQLQEKRFGIGRVNTLAVIQAGDDATTAEFTYNTEQTQRKLAAWKVLHLAGFYPTYLEKLKNETFN